MDSSRTSTMQESTLVTRNPDNATQTWQDTELVAKAKQVEAGRWASTLLAQRDDSNIVAPPDSTGESRRLTTVHNRQVGPRAPASPAEEEWHGLSS
eukprot:6241966-Amphidinium_carterae.1